MASFTSSLPPSEILRSKGKTGDDVGLRQSKDQYRKQKELEEARKAGTEPAATDESGRDINPHIPQFISSAPWYLGAGGPTLKHQRTHPEREKQLSAIGDWYKRGVTAKVATKYRKGACENCGATTHKKKDCFERPRKTGAKYTGEDIAPDDHEQDEFSLDYDAKRDRWNGYNPAEHKEVIEEFKALEETRKMLKAEMIKEGTIQEDEEKKEEEEKKDEDEIAKDEDKYAEDADMPGVKTDMDSRTRITVRNLRIREDTAKYLYNLDPDSAYYDPKSRSMRENPFQGTNKEQEAVKFSGENFVRFTGEVCDANEAQLFAWDALRKGVDVNALAEPTKLEVLRKDLDIKKGSTKSDAKQAILDRYGGEEHLDAPPKELLLAQTEAYVEYSRKGSVLKGEERQAIKSRYDEDIYHNNHTSVWGSFWKDGQWGYKCCHSMVKNSYCTGDAGKMANEITVVKPQIETKEAASEETEEVKEDESKEKSESSPTSDNSVSDSSDSDEETKKDNREKAKKRREKKRSKRQKKRHAAKNRPKSDKKKESSSDSESSEDEVKKSDSTSLGKALKKQAEEERKAEKMLELGDRKRAYNSHYEVKAPTDTDMEAYRLRQIHDDDPMAEYMAKKRKK